MTASLTRTHTISCRDAKRSKQNMLKFWDLEPLVLTCRINIYPHPYLGNSQIKGHRNVGFAKPCKFDCFLIIMEKYASTWSKIWTNKCSLWVVLLNILAYNWTKQPSDWTPATFINRCCASVPIKDIHYQSIFVQNSLKLEQKKSWRILTHVKC